MKNLTVLFGVIIGFTLMVSCKGAKDVQKETVAVPFEVANGYFVKNDVDPSILKNGKISTESEFSSIFGAATVMGPNGKPTVIDFSKQYVVAIIGQETDSATTITPVGLEKANDKLTFIYDYTVGDKQSFTMKPVLIIVVDSDNKEDLVLVKRND